MQTASDETVTDLVKNERVLWLAVVERAIHDTLDSKPSIRRRAIDWLLHDDVDFPRICEVAGLDITYLRRRIAAKRGRPERGIAGNLMRSSRRHAPCSTPGLLSEAKRMFSSL